MLYTARLWNATKTLAEDAKRTADRQASEMQASLRIAQESADAAKKMAVTMEDTAERQLRAYALVSHVKIVNDPEPGHSGQWVYIEIRNFGQTPATDISYSADMQIREMPLLPPLLVIDPLIKRQTVGVLPPDDPFVARIEIPLLEGNGDGHDIVQGTHALYVFGKFRYKDAFNRERDTPFCYMRSGEHWNSDGQLEICQDGNDPT